MPPTIVLVRWGSLIASIPLTLYFLGRMLGVMYIELFPFEVAVAGSVLLVLLDSSYSKYQDLYKDQLFALLKDFGENMSAGMAVETAVQNATGWRNYGPAREFNRALAEAQNVPFTAALAHIGARSRQTTFREVTGLLTLAVRAGGDIGSSVRWLGAHFTTLRAVEKEFTSKINSSIKLMWFVGLLAAPFMYTMLASSFANFVGADPEDGIAIAAVWFYAFGSAGMASLDGLVYGRWWNVPPKMPLFMALTYIMMGFN